MAVTVDYWQPAPPLRRYISGYHRYRLPRGRDPARFDDVFFPAWSNIRFTFDADPYSVTLARRVFDPVPDCAFFGPSSHAGYVSAGAGIMIGVGLTPAGWSLLSGDDVSTLADRIVPLDRVFPDLAARRDEIGAAADPAAYFDRLFGQELERREPAGAVIELVLERLLDPTVEKVADLGEGLDLSPRQVARLARHCFGFTPKLLLRRARFLRVLTAVMDRDRGLWANAIRDAGYWDGSHFLRDCHLFLGTSLGEFIDMPRPLNRLSMRRREEVLGAPMQSLHHREDG